MSARCSACDDVTTEHPLPILCTRCGRADTYFEEGRAASSGSADSSVAPALVRTLADDPPTVRRIRTGFSEFDKLFDGGLALGAALLVYGGPGSGKSTLTLKLVAGVAETLDERALVVCPEMSHAILARTANGAGADVSRLVRCEDPSAWEKEAHALGTRALLVDSVSKMPRDTLESVITWARERDAVAVCLAHQTMSGSARGGAGTGHDPDVVCRVYLNRRTEERTLTIEKSRTCALGSLQLAPPVKKKRPRAGVKPSRGASVAGGARREQRA